MEISTLFIIFQIFEKFVTKYCNKEIFVPSLRKKLRNFSSLH